MLRYLKLCHVFRLDARGEAMTHDARCVVADQYVRTTTTCYRRACEYPKDDNSWRATLTVVYDLLLVVERGVGTQENQKRFLQIDRFRSEVEPMKYY